jgi:hypothetical protein
MPAGHDDPPLPRSGMPAAGETDCELGLSTVRRGVTYRAAARVGLWVPAGESARACRVTVERNCDRGSIFRTRPVPRAMDDRVPSQKSFRWAGRSACGHADGCPILRDDPVGRRPPKSPQSQEDHDRSQGLRPRWHPDAERVVTEAAVTAVCYRPTGVGAVPPNGGARTRTW